MQLASIKSVKMSLLLKVVGFPGSIIFYVWYAYTLPTRMSPVSGFITFFAITCLLFWVAFVFLLSKKPKKRYELVGSIGTDLFLAAVLSTLCTIFFGLFRTTTVEFSTVFVDKAGIVIHSIPPDAPTRSRIFWSKNPLLRKSKRFSFAEETTLLAFAGPHSVTENPKVRNIAYAIKIQHAGSVENFLAHRKVVAQKGGTEKWLRFWLYELNEKKSPELALFYNPEDENQQKMFFELVNDFLQPHLKEGNIRLVGASFYDPSDV